METATAHIEAAIVHTAHLTAQAFPATTCAEDVTVHKASMAVYIVAAKVRKEAATNHIVAITAHMHPFESAATSYEKR